jgi:hypothetical protein
LSIRQIARIRLACKRLDRYVAGVDVTPGDTVTKHEASTIDDMNEHVTALVHQLIDDLGYSA